MLIESPDAVAVLGAIGLFLPLVVSLLKRPGWTTTTKRVAAFAVAGVAAVVYTGSQVGWDHLLSTEPAVVVSNLFLIWVTAQTAFAHLWKETAIESRLAGEDPADVDHTPPI